jgi:hypothetical protein
MARLQTRQRSGTEEARDATPDGDQQLDEWFTKRLESRGIPVHIGRGSVTRIFSLVAFCLALVGLLWAFSVAGGSKDSSAESAPASAPGDTAPAPNSGKSTGGQKTTGKQVDWRAIPLDILNGFGGSGAATSQETLLTSQGWQVRSTGNAGSSTQKTIVVYTPGNKAKASVVAHRLHLAAPVPIDTVPDVDPSTVSQVAIVLGPDLLPQ